jgi:hypothetical protein
MVPEIAFVLLALFAQGDEQEVQRNVNPVNTESKEGVFL